MAYKPEGYTSVAPYLIVDGAEKTLAFLKQVFDTEPLRKYDNGGRVHHAEVRIDDTVVMVADSVEGYPPLPASVHVYVKDVDATWKKALAAGAVAVQEPVQKEDADKRGGFKEPGGTTWWIGTQVG
ncbi:MAG: VOC family protein [Polyangiales bacterium]